MSAAVRVRPMTAPDIEKVTALAAELPQAPQWRRWAYVAALDADAAVKRVALVAEAGETGAVAGFAVASLPGAEAELETIGVSAGLQRRGVGRQLFTALAAELARRGVTEVLLEVRASNTAALGLYQALGFTEIGRRPRYYADPAEDAVLMRVRLG